MRNLTLFASLLLSTVAQAKPLYDGPVPFSVLFL